MQGKVNFLIFFTFFVKKTALFIFIFILSDFETRLYLCHGGFEYLQKDILFDLTIPSFLLPIYIIGQLVYLFAFVKIGLKNISNKSLNNKKDNQYKDKHLAFFTSEFKFQPYFVNTNENISN